MACYEAESLAEKYPDFSSLYLWHAMALIRMNSFDKARHVLKKGLELGNEKYLLCNRFGELEWKARNIKMAVYWWAQGLQCQESLNCSNYGNNEGAYLYLHYVAEGSRLPECAKAFLMRVDSIKSGMIRFDRESANDLIELSYYSGIQEIKDILSELVNRYITTSC